MIPVYLCDDEPVWLERLNNAISNYQIKSDWDFRIECQTTSPEELLTHIANQVPKGGVYFLDIDLKASINGMTLATRIKQIDPLASLVFITTHDEMVMETFRLKLEALEYIVKDTSPLDESIDQCLAHLESKYIATNSSPTNFISIHVNGFYRTVPVQDIYYIETVKGTHKVRMHLPNAILNFSDSITSLQQRLGADFYHCHKAYIVNIKHIAVLDTTKHEIILDNGCTCPCSTREWRKLLVKYKDNSL